VHAYNHADWYVQKVLRLAAELGSAGDGPIPDVDGLRASVERAQAKVAAATAAVAAARASESRIGERHHRLLHRSTRLPLFTARLAYQRLAALAGGDVLDARAQATNAARRLAKAEADLAHKRKRLDAAERARARRLAAIRRAQAARRRLRRKAAAPATGWAQQVPWFDGFASAGVPGGGAATRLGAPALRVLSRPAPIIRFALNR
jgi:hypothetical protein